MRGRLRHRHRHRGRQDGRRRGHRPHASPRAASAVAVFKPAVTGLDDDRRRGGRARPRAAAARGRAARRRATRRSPPTATGRRSRRTWRRSWPASEIDPERLLRGRAAPRRRRRRARLRGRRRPARPAHARLPGARPRRSTSALPLVVAASPGLGTINHTLLTIEAARAAGLEVAAVVLTPWPERADRDRAVQPRDDRRARQGRGRDAAEDRPRGPGILAADGPAGGYWRLVEGRNGLASGDGGAAGVDRCLASPPG